MTERRRWFVAASVWAVLFGFAVTVSAQAAGRQGPPAVPAPARAARAAAREARAGGPPVPPNPDVMTVQDVEQYFDQVVLYQARTQLRLSDDQFLHFGARLRSLQMLRRQQERQRAMGLRELNQLLNATPMDEASVAAKLKSLDDQDAESNRQIQEAYTGLEQVLDVGQRARFRIFEEMTERRKLDLLARARQQAAAPAGQQGPPPAGR